MDYTKLNELKSQYGDYEEVFNSGDYDKAADILMKVLDVIELEYEDKRKAGMLDNDLNVRKSEGTDKIWLCTNHIMEYYIYACYFEPQEEILMPELPIAEYYRTYADLCVKLQKYKRAEDAYKKALCWNPVDLDSYLGLAECYKYLNMMSRYLDVTKQAYRFCCTRATMARYYRNMGFYYLSSYNTDMAITVAPSPSNQMEVIDDDSFSYDGYQVVRGEFFAHIYEPSFTFNNYKVSVNTACIKKLPDVEYVQILVNPIEKKLAVRPCREEEKDSFRWCSSGKKRSPKQITCRIFFAKVISLMDWNPNYRYKILGKLIRSGNEILFIFDLTSPEIFPRTLKDNGTVTTARTPSYPEEWKNQFGIPVEEHQKSMQVNIFEGYAVFDIQEKKKATDKSIEKAKEPSTAESEEKSYEQQTLFPSTNMY